MQTFFQIVGREQDNGNLDMMTREQLEAEFGDLAPSTNGALRPELRGQPCIPGLCGPSWGGWRDAEGNNVFLKDDRDPTSEVQSYSRHKGPIVGWVVRYETQEAADFLSR